MDTIRKITNEKLRRLLESYFIETDTSRKFQLEYQIQEVHADSQKFGIELDADNAKRMQSLTASHPGETRATVDSAPAKPAQPPAALPQKIARALMSLPNLNTRQAYQALLFHAGIDAQLEYQIDFSQPPVTFFPILVQTLSKYGTLANGQQALAAVLEAAKTLGGIEHQINCERLIREVEPPLYNLSEEKMMNVKMPVASNKIENFTPSIKRDKIFISYSQKDKEWLERVQTHLKVLQNIGIPVNVWDDTTLKAGERWRVEIEKALASAKVAILLVSTDFLASEFISKNELPPLLKAAEDDGATILPVILKTCLFTKQKELAAFQAVNKPSEPLAKMSENDQEETLVALTERIMELMEKSHATQSPADE